MKRRKGEEGKGKGGVKCKRWRLKNGAQKKKKKARWEREAPLRGRGLEKDGSNRQQRRGENEPQMTAGVTRNCGGEAKGEKEIVAGKVGKWEESGRCHRIPTVGSVTHPLREAVSCLNVADLWATKQ